MCTSWYVRAVGPQIRRASPPLSSAGGPRPNFSSGLTVGKLASGSKRRAGKANLKPVNTTQPYTNSQPYTPHKLAHAMLTGVPWQVCQLVHWRGVLPNEAGAPKEAGAASQGLQLV